ncbi:MAG TPA: FAD-dependent oxidoreductase [Vicinamibacterales bacterium]|jgi:NADPH-dependent 2,4-dienoyl-CoA reductase/sulfur reductase-like enzyme/nitrite reductase/ring-hydroxylating ferredoxin subunit|nr:FAD-dependent oxidoreductase [Vicinamibacterales bacterium]
MSTDLTAGVRIDSLPDGATLAGHIGEDEIVLVRRGDRVFAVGAHCTHYHGPLADGLVVGDTVRCPWHHACFDLATGEALRAPALDSVACWRVERKGDTVFVREKLPPKTKTTPVGSQHPSSIVIVGGGGAGLAAVDMLRREGYAGPIAMISTDADPPVDRPNLSKDYLAGEAQPDWIPLWPEDLYREKRVDLVLGARATSIDVAGRRVKLEGGTSREFGALLIASGADPIQLPIPGANTADVRYLRSFGDSRAIVERASSAKRALIVGASFIGLEVAASLRARGIAVDVVAPETRPLERVMGPEVGRFVQGLHEAHGVTFHLGETVKSIAGGTVILSGGTAITADLVVVGAGVKPSIAIAESSGLAVDRGITVNEYLETSAPGIFAAGDVARWPDPHSGEKIRVEHWVVAERQGQTAARNMLGARKRFDAVPFFWSQHYDVTIRYVGHAERWDDTQVEGSLEKRDASVNFLRGGRRLAVATISRDRANLEAEVELEGAVRSPAI